jgi:hypothetical protein
MTTIGDSAPRRNLWAKCMTMVGVLIAAANMGLGWKVMLENRPSMPHAVQVAVPQAMTSVPATHLIDRIHEINVAAIWKEAAHQYAISTVGVSLLFWPACGRVCSLCDGH